MDFNFDVVHSWKPKYSIDLFAGAGGGTIASKIGGIETIAAVEIDAEARKMFLRRFPDIPVWDDITTFRPDNPECAGIIEILRQHRNNLIIAGGFPCKDISPAGSGEGLRGEYSRLWFEFSRTVCDILPRYVYLENSEFLISRGIQYVLRELAAMGYNACWGVLGASDVGAWHQRKRIWITAILDNSKCARLEGYGDFTRKAA